MGGLSNRVGVRARAAIAATLVASIALGVGAVVLLVLLHSSLTQSVKTSAMQRATDVAAQLTAGGGDSPAAVVPRTAGERSLVQVLDASGRVLVSSPEIDGEAPLSSARPASGREVTTTGPLPVGDEDTFVIVTRAVSTMSGPRTVVVAESLARVQQSVRTVGSLLLAGLPILLAVLACGVYYVVGRALRPIESMRQQVAGISSSDLSRRIPVPLPEDEVARLAATMNDMLDRLQRAQLAQHRFIADASHELRSPLAAVRASIEVAAAHPTLASWDTTAANVLDETSRMDHLVGDLLLLARADEDGIRGDRHDVDLDDILVSERDRLRRTSSLVVVSNIRAAQVCGDRRQLQRVVRNLVDNAARYASSTVTLSLSTDDRTAVLVVGDDGPGVPDDETERVFDRFVRLDVARDRESGGTGLGLAIVAEVIRAHDGQVRVEGGDSGANFVVELPLSDAASGPPGI